MGLVLNEEQQMLQSTAQEFFSSSLPVDAFRKARDKHQVVQYSEAAWRQMVELGWGAILVPESLEGLEFGLTGMGVICIEAARNLAASPLQSAATLSVESLLRCDVSDSRDELLKAIASGARRPAFAIGEPHGIVEFVPEGMAADCLLLLNTTQGSAPSLLLFELNDDAISRSAVSLIDQRDYAHIELQGMPAAATFEIVANAESVTEHINDVGALITACELFGCSSEAFDRTIDYLCEREQFGQKIGAFQALQHRMAKAYMQLQLLKSVLYDALQALEGEREDASLAVSHAKVLANETAQLVCTEAIQMHGGMGITDELDIGLFYKRSRVIRTVFGSTAYHRQRFAQLSGL